MFFALVVISALVLPVGCGAPTLKTPEISSIDARREAEKQRELAFQVYVKRQEKLYGMGWPLLVSGAALCQSNDARVGVEYGFLIHDRSLYHKDFRDAADEYFDLGDDVSVRYVHPKFPAWEAGLRRGDVIISVNGVDVIRKERERPERDDDISKEIRKYKDKVSVRVKEKGAEQVRKIIKNADVEKGVTFVVERDGTESEITVKGSAACAFNVVLVTDDAVNAFADGKNVVITTGMMRFTETMEELSIVVAHEIAHNALSHIDKKKKNAMMGTVLDMLLLYGVGINTQGMFGQSGAMKYSQEFESEADYAGLYIAARAGYDISEAPYFWRRMAVEHPGAIKDSYNSTHPSAPKRFLALDETIREIEDKRQRGEELLPELLPETDKSRKEKKD